ncbi:MAG: PSD1 and planctomycete cytochrome C domain-containing protein [Gemmataceae bacterium]|nr:PSD1 and planctomycete cytochrome C domain-containing protein [Gemmataceae bacterium]
MNKFAFACLAFGLAVSGADAQDKLEFNRDIRPILAEACFKCHGPAAKKGGLRLDSREDAIKPGRSKAIAIVEGKPEQSELIRRILATDVDKVMPPPASHKTLKPAEKEILKRWIAQGAAYQKHWSLETPTKAAIPQTGDAHPIDAFITARLKKEGLQRSREADRTTLIRRVSFAVTGLPPTIAEIDAFLADNNADAYEKMVDRYLASPRFGEEMARYWLDVARYADTHGLHLDNERQMWLYRDWVVRSFNNNLPYSQFLTEQIAGDLIPNATSEQVIATGFSRCNVTTGEGGSIDSEWVFRNAVDRTSTMMEGVLGLTGGCAVCHDHKFDPISAKDYYSLFAFFYSAAGPALDGNAMLTEPAIKAPSSEQTKKLDELTKQIAAAQDQRAKSLKSVDYKEPADPKLANSPAHSFVAWKKHAEKDQKGLPKEIIAIVKAAKANPAQDNQIKEYYLEKVCEATKPMLEPLAKQLAELTKTKADVEKAIIGSVVFKELPTPRKTNVMMRGQYDKPGEEVEPNTPSVLPPLKKANPKRATRLDLANWLTAREQPLTSRVAVNRLWQQMFGTGLVKTSADFGVQGEVPSHPELLDFLSIWFQENGWDTKKLLRLMLTSASFRQDSKLTADLLRRDPENRLYARGPRFRLDAEQIRDNALFISGLINLEIGGRGVRPYQPPRIWEPVAFTGSNTMNYAQDKGPALYRRSLYTFYKRTAPPPFLTNFDAPNRESSCSRRERSNTPMQALQLMNDVQHFEAARKFAERILTEGGTSPADRIRYAYRATVSRQPEAGEIEIVQRTQAAYLDRFQKNPEAAKQALRYGESPARAGLNEAEVASWAMVANLLLNLDESLNRN